MHTFLNNKSREHQRWLSNHLGNVLVTISDKKLQHSSDNVTVDYSNADVVTANDYYPFGMLQPGRQFNNGSTYRYGFNGQEKSSEIGINTNTAEFWEYDSRIGRRWNIEPLFVKYPNMSTYVVLNNNPINGFDPNGKDVIFVNGYIAGRNSNVFDYRTIVQHYLKTTYWNSKNKGFTNEVERYLNDHTEHFVSGDHWGLSDAGSRMEEGRQSGIRMVLSGEIKVSKTNNIMTIVMHSQGNAEGIGIAEGIIEQAKRQGVVVKVNLVFLAVHQPIEINEKLTPELAKRGIQFTYANDNAGVLQPQAKQPYVPDLKGVADANKENKNWKTDGIQAHSAPIDDPAAFDAIKKTDQKKQIFVIRPDPPK